MKALLSIGLIILFVLGCSPKNPVQRPESALRPNSDQIRSTGEKFTPWIWKKIRVVAAGDFIPHGAVLQSARDHAAHFDSLNFDGYRYLIDKIVPLINGDLNLINFESPCAPSQSLHPKPYIFNAPEAALDALHWAGFNVFLLANNHMYDQGRNGLRETIQLFQKKGYAFAGAHLTKWQSEKPLMLTVNGVNIGILSYTQFLNTDENHPDSAWVNVLDRAAALRTIVRYRDSVDILLLTYHGGQEYESYPTKSIQNFFHAAIDSGVHAIIGGHPHVPQPLEIYRAQDGRLGLIFYSLGNFISNQSRKYLHPISDIRYGDTRDVPLAIFSFALVDYGPNGKKWEIHDVGIIPAWTENNYFESVTGGKKDIHLISIFHELQQIDDMLKEVMEKVSSNQTGNQRSDGENLPGTTPVAHTSSIPVPMPDSDVRYFQARLDSLISRKAHFLKRLQRFEQIFGDEFIINPLR